MSGQPTVRQVTGWAEEVTAVGERIGRHFARSEPRRRAVGYIRGLLGDDDRKNGWQLAEHRGDPTPDGGLDQPTARVAISGNEKSPVALPADGRSVVAWDLTRGVTLCRVGHGRSAVGALALSPDGKSLATAGTAGKTVHIWKLDP